MFIEEEAFEGTSFQTLFFEDGLLAVGERAFSRMNQLKDIYFPSSTVYIADEAFYSSRPETIHGKKGTYAQSWAEDHHVQFEFADCWLMAPLIVRFSVILATLSGSLCPLPISEVQKIKRYINRIMISMRPQDRPELYPIDYRFP